MTPTNRPRQRATTRAKKTQEVRDKILEVAARFFVEKGYHGTSLQDIASEAGIKKAALYYYYPSKELLCFKVFEHLGREMITDLEKTYASQVPAVEKLRLAMECHIRWVSQQTDSLTVFLRESEYLSGAYLEQVRQIRDGYESWFRRIIAAAVREGQIRPIDPKFTSMAILGMCNWLYRWYKPGGKLPSEIASIFWELIYEGLHPRCPEDSTELRDAQRAGTEEKRRDSV